MLNVVGERHNETETRLQQEKEYCSKKTLSDNYWEESELLHRDNPADKESTPTFADPALQSAAALVHLANDKLYPAAKKAVEDAVFLSTPDFNEASQRFRTYGQALDEERDQFTKYWDKQYRAGSWPAFEQEREAFAGKLSSITIAPKKQSQKTERANTLHQLEQNKINMDKHWSSWRGAEDTKGVRGGPEKIVAGKDTGISMERSIFMDEAAKGWGAKLKGVWKIGQEHVDEIIQYRSEPNEYNLVPKTAFNERIEADQKKI